MLVMDKEHQKGQCLFYYEAFFSTSRLLLFTLRALLSVSPIVLVILRWCQNSPSRSFLKTHSTDSDDGSLFIVQHDDGDEEGAMVSLLAASSTGAKQMAHSARLAIQRT